MRGVACDTHRTTFKLILGPMCIDPPPFQASITPSPFLDFILANARLTDVYPQAQHKGFEVSVQPQHLLICCDSNGRSGDSGDSGSTNVHAIGRRP